MSWYNHWMAIRETLLTESGPLLAGLALLDLAGGLSFYLAERLGIKEQADAVLAWMLALCFLIFGNTYVYHPNYLHLWDDAELVFIKRTVELVGFASAILAALLALRKGRSFFLWLMLGYLGNIGALAWLHFRGAKRTCPAEIFQVTGPR